MKKFLKRLLLAWRHRVWPWDVPWEAVEYLALDQRPTENEIARARELAHHHGFED